MKQKDYVTSLEYIDVRGPWPVYVHGVYAVQLPGKPRSITVADAREVISNLK